MLKKYLVAINNKYVLTALGLIVWVAFFDKNDFRTLIKQKHEVKQLEEERNYYANEITNISFELKELTTNKIALEKFAREKYLMKRRNEDIFVIVEK